MSTKSYETIPVHVDEIQLSMLGFDIADAQARLACEWNEYDNVFEYEVHWSVRGRFDPDEWRDRFSSDWAPELVPMIDFPALGSLPVVWHWYPLEEGKRKIKISERRDVLKTDTRIDASAISATLSAFDSARVDYHLVPVMRDAVHLPVEVVTDDVECNCVPRVQAAHASLISDEDDEQYLQLYILGSLDLCELASAGSNSSRGRRAREHELPKLTVDLLDDTGFMLEERDYLIDLQVQGTSQSSRMRQPRWIYSDKIAVERLTSVPGRVIATFSGDA